MPIEQLRLDFEAWANRGGAYPNLHDSYEDGVYSGCSDAINAAWKLQGCMSQNIFFLN